MFQSFNTPSEPQHGPGRLQQLREQMQAVGATHYLIPHADEHQNEYQPARVQRLSWLTGFSGSAGFAIATLSQCVVFVDGRYTIQVREQIDPSAFEPGDLVNYPPAKWLEDNTNQDSTIAFDPWLITPNQFKAYEKACEKTGATLKEVDNLIDLIWDNQPSAPAELINLHPIEFAGKSAEQKIDEIQAAIEDCKADSAVLTDPASLAWLFNIRGSDVSHNPLALGFAIVPTHGKPSLFMANEKLKGNVKQALENIAILNEPDQFLPLLAKAAENKRIHCDRDRISAAVSNAVTQNGGQIVSGRDPVSLPKAIKNDIEIEGSRVAHVRDGVAMCRFLCWLDAQEVKNLDEISAAKQLEQYRLETAQQMGSTLEDISFGTISGFGPHAAIPHYSVSEESNLNFSDNNLYLCDSGGQYRDGTTDITRTMAIGTPPGEAVKDFTLVLKGHIAMASARFPEGTKGLEIDVMARQPLWSYGRDFAHGTGHGIGSYLNVHEGPQSISKRGHVPLQAGMIVSNEPGYYVAGEYGIRIENLVLVTEAETIENGNIKTMAFETLTLAPIDLRLIDKNLLRDDEKAWLNNYHATVHATLSPHLNETEQAWLKQATAAI